MSMTEQGVRWQLPVTDSPLRAAIDRFDEYFGYDIHLPMLTEDVQAAADMAELRGRHDIAEEIRAALKLTLQA